MAQGWGQGKEGMLAHAHGERHSSQAAPQPQPASKAPPPQPASPAPRAHLLPHEKVSAAQLHKRCTQPAGQPPPVHRRGHAVLGSVQHQHGAGGSADGGCLGAPHAVRQHRADLPALPVWALPLLLRLLRPAAAAVPLLPLLPLCSGGGSVLARERRLTQLARLVIALRQQGWREVEADGGARARLVTARRQQAQADPGSPGRLGDSLRGAPCGLEGGRACLAACGKSTPADGCSLAAPAGAQREALVS